MGLLTYFFQNLQCPYPAVLISENEAYTQRYQARNTATASWSRHTDYSRAP